LCVWRESKTPLRLQGSTCYLWYTLPVSMSYHFVSGLYLKKKLKLLVIDEEFPWPVNTGKRARTFNLISQLAKTHSVEYLAYNNLTELQREEFEKSSIRTKSVPMPDRRQSGLRFYLRLVRNLFSRYPYIVTSHYSKAFENKLRETLAQDTYDMVLAEWSPYAIFMKDIPEVPFCCVAHNIESGIWRRYELTEKKPLKKLYITIQRKKVEAFELQCFTWARCATAVTSQEKEWIETNCKQPNVAVIENGVAIDYFRISDGKAPKNNSLVFTGSMDWRPNQDGVQWFTEKIFPVIRTRYPGASFTVVGRNPPAYIAQLPRKHPGVVVTGTVDDVRGYIDQSAVYVVPLRVGGGSRLKILEALSMGKIVVSTTTGAEGLRTEHGEHLLLADTEEQFAKTVCEVIAHPQTYKHLGENGRRLVEEHYNWPILAERLGAFLHQMAGR